MTPALQRYLDAAFGIDLRTLALFRIGLGAVIAVDLLRRLAFDLVAFHTALGVLPGADLLMADSVWRINLLLVNDQPWWSALLISTAFVSALCLMLGYRTRLAVVVLFVLMGSIHNRNPLILIGGDLLIMALLFWAMFLPLAARCSVDAVRAVQPPPVANLHRSWGSAGLLIQVMSVYFFSAVLKSGADWWPDGLAVYYTMELERYATPFARAWLVDQPLLMQGLSYFVYFIEWIGPPLVFLPFWSRAWRFVVMLLLMGMHIGFLLCIEIGHFPYVSLVSLSAFIGGWMWDAAGHRDIGAGLRRFGARLREWLRQRLARRTIRFETGSLAQTMAAVMLPLVMVWNLGTVEVLPRARVEALLISGFRLLRLDQIWNMFAPYPSRADGWTVFPGVLEDGRVVDVLRPGQPLDWSKPARPSQHESVRWHTYRWRLWEKERVAHRSLYARYLCRDWNLRATPGDRLVKLHLVWMQEFSRPPSEFPELKPFNGWQHQCVDDDLVPPGLPPVPAPP